MFSLENQIASNSREYQETLIRDGVKELPLRILSIISIGMEMEPQEMKLRLKIILSVWKQIISMYLYKEVEAMR